MANYPITKDQLINASTDADTLEAVISGAVDRSNPGNPDGTVTTRLGTVIKTLARAILDLTLTDVDDEAVNSLREYFQSEFSKLGLWPEQAPIIDEAGRVYDLAVVDRVGEIVLGALAGGGASISNLMIRTGRKDGVTPFSISDSDNAQAFGIDSDGGVLLNKVIVKTHAALPNGYIFAIADGEGQAALAITADGQVIIGKQEDPTTGMKSLSNQRTDYMHIFMYGQSLSRGSTASPVISTTQPFANVTFKGGVLNRSMDAGVDYTDFKPLVEESLETPTSGACNRMSELIAAGGDSSTWQFVGTAPGNGGTSIVNLSKGTVYWNSMMDQVAAGVSVSASHDQTYSVWAMLWAQGEQNYNTNDTIEQYVEKFIGMKNDFALDVAERTSQDFIPPLITYQVVAHRRYGKNHNNVAIAQWKAAQRNVDIIMACTIYNLPHSSDNLHLTNNSSEQLGRYFAKALHQTIIEGKPFKPLWPEHILWQGRLIDITFNAPVGSLQFDTTLVSEAPNYGFDIWYADENDNAAIATVALVGSNRVRIKMARDPRAGDILTYARGRIGDPATGGPVTGARGNLRDQAGDTDNYTDTDGNIKYMHNWCVMFQHEYQ